MYKISYVADGVAATFAFAFPFFQNADIRVAINDVVLDNTKFDTIANQQFDGGVVVFSNAPINGDRIDIYRQISLARIVDYQPTAKIDPENLNSDFNFLLAAFQDLRAVDIDLSEWKNIHDNVLTRVEYTINMIEDKLSGGGVLGIYNNLISVLDGALPKLINDYGSVTEPAPNENRDDYGIL